jgi:CheY-like chemotaxis protein
MTTPIETVIVRPIVLLVDDEPAVLEALSALLAPKLEPGFRVESAASAEEALELVGSAYTAGSSPVALVISDEKMPGQTGTDLLVALRQHPAHRNGGRIIVTGYAGLASAQRAINDAEVDRYYPKPWNAERDLLPAVGEILARFARKTGLDRFLTVELAKGPWELTQLREIRKAWREYLGLIGIGPASIDGEEPDLNEPEDDGATLFLARRAEAKATHPAGTLRLRRDAAGRLILDGLAFQPEEAGDEVEDLMLRAALLHAAAAGIDEIACEAPVLRREVYEAVGFKNGAEPAQGGSIAMTVRPVAAVESFGPFASRWRVEPRLCSCKQTGCPRADYALARRRYYCPLDVREGRVPDGFPLTALR